LLLLWVVPSMLKTSAAAWTVPKPPEMNGMISPSAPSGSAPTAFAM
jgi:hypothetical protein